MKSKQQILKPVPAPNAPARPLWKKRLAIALVAYTVTGFFILPAIVKWQLRKQLPILTHRQAEVKQVRMNPYALSLTIRGLSLIETNGEPFVAFDEFYVNFQLSSLFRWAWTFGEIRLVHPSANLVRLADGRFNFSNLASTNAAPSPPSTNPPPPVIIQSLVVTNAVVSFADHTTPQPFTATYGPINVDVKDFTTRRAKHGPYTFVATTSDGESFAWSGRFSVNPPQSSGQFKLIGISPAKYSPYLAQFTTVKVASGTINIGASYYVNAASVPVELDVTNATFQLRDFVLKAPDTKTNLLALNNLLVINTSASLTGHVARIGLLSLQGGSVFIQRETNGQPTLLNYLVQQTNSATTVSVPATNTPPSPPWDFFLDELDIAGFSAAVEDHSVPGVAEVSVDDLRLNLKGFSNRTNTPVDSILSFNWRGGGTARIASHGTLLPPALTNSIAITNLALAPLQPYVGQQANLVIHSGGLSVNGTSGFNPAATPQIKFNGDVSITNFTVSDTISFHELAAWDNHVLRGINFSLKTNWLSVEEIHFTGWRSSLVVNSNGLLNVGALAKTPPASTETPAAPITNSTPAELFPIRVGALVFEKSSLRVADDSLERRFETSIEEFSGSIRDIALPGLDKATVDVHGKVSALSPFEITGEVTPDPKNLFVNLKIAFTNTDLTSLSPYAEKFVGRPLNKGKLTTELRYSIENRALNAANVVALDQLTLGAKNDSTNATGMPVKLAIGLLKDIHGRIDLDLPIKGSLDDPKFSIGGVVLDVFKNLILKVATSPFSLLGALVGGGEELQFVEFNPGLATLNESQTNKLVKLAEALHKRPALSLEIHATFDGTNDVSELGRQKVLERIKSLSIEETVARGKPAPAIETLKLEDADYERLLRKAYQSAFKTTPEQGLREALAAAIATNSPTGSTATPDTANTLQESQKGSASLMQRGKSLSQLAAIAGTKLNPSAPNAKPKTERELIREELERRLATTTPVNATDLAALMQARSDAVQKFLIDSCGVEAERVFPTAPKPDDSASRGAAHVIFSLE